ncbi:MAG: ArsR family transcriptional regulator [Bacteroidia bacterium]|nr:ArsR family transcriptional regulator [Bacteroidia bacterium]
MLETLVTSKTRVKLLLKFFLNPATKAYLRSLEAEFGDSTNAIRLELNRFEKANMLTAEISGNKKIFQVNQQHPLFEDINKIIRKYVGIDVLLESIVNQLGKLDAVYLSGNLAQGMDDKIIDLVFLGNINKIYLLELIPKAEKVIKRKIRFLVYTPEEFSQFEKNGTDYLLIWNK